MDLIVEAFSEIGESLVVIGDGPEFEKLSRKAGPNVELLGYQPNDTVAEYLQRARAFVFAAEEDFGIVPIEAQAAGCPVIAYGKGGVLETVTGWPASDPTGVFFHTQTTESLQAAVHLFEDNEDRFEPEVCRRNAERFGRLRFQQELRATVEEAWRSFWPNE
jgi:glycosyltransferase involved in cell wall biosynthesis